MEVKYLGKIRGYREGNTYYTDRTPETFFCKFQGFAISLKILDIMYQKGVEWIVINYHGKTDVKYKCKLKDFIMSDLEHTDTLRVKGNLVYDKQKIMKVKVMENV